MTRQFTANNCHFVKEKWTKRGNLNLDRLLYIRHRLNKLHSLKKHILKTFCFLSDVKIYTLESRNFYKKQHKFIQAAAAFNSSFTSFLKYQSIFSYFADCYHTRLCSLSLITNFRQTGFKFIQFLRYLIWFTRRPCLDLV